MKNYLLIGTKKIPCTTLVEARNLWETYRDEEGLGASETPKLAAIIDGVEYRISYNGRAWLGEQEIGTKPCECGALDPVWHQREDEQAFWMCPRCWARRTGL